MGELHKELYINYASMRLGITDTTGRALSVHHFHVESVSSPLGLLTFHLCGLSRGLWYCLPHPHVKIPAWRKNMLPRRHKVIRSCECMGLCVRMCNSAHPDLWEGGERGKKGKLVQEIPIPLTSRTQPKAGKKSKQWWALGNSAGENSGDNQRTPVYLIILHLGSLS